MKKAIRNGVLAIRDQMPSEIRAQKDLRIRENLFSLPEFFSAKTILLYASFRSEVATLSLIGESLSIGKRVFLPKVDAKKSQLILYEVKNVDELAPGYMGIPEPHLPDERRKVIDEVDLAIVPGAAFDFSGNRIGYGAGYYDTLLSKRTEKMLVFGVAYEEQLVSAIPAEKHDVRVSVIITDERVIRTS